MTFMFAGSDTTANTLAFCLYEVARRPEVQAKIQEELQQVLGDTPTGNSDSISHSAFRLNTVKAKTHQKIAAWCVRGSCWSRAGCLSEPLFL